ncbi:hypothetical protein [Streptomyces sp. C8S0]|uniref:hypothetical protein n=1 Tax=Streptomyces sp. C8S0 TaxID=2585716 RepID=UPI001D041F70|nr:hypothetical protein [Streptomyces sp. C8S0]
MLRAALPELTALEAWRLALGWSRAQAIREVARVYLEDDLLPPALSQALLCRYEHGQAQPGDEYRIMISRAYGARPDQLGSPRTTSGAVRARPRCRSTTVGGSARNRASTERHP